MDLPPRAQTPDPGEERTAARRIAASDAVLPNARQGQRFHRWMRLVRARDFAHVYRSGSRARGDLVTVALVRNGLAHSRLGLSIGRKVWKGAVRRNRIRRLVREAFRLDFDALPPGFDLVVIGSQPAIDPTLVDLRRELVKLAAKAARRAAEREG